MKNKILKSVQDAILAAQKLSDANSVDFMEKASFMISNCFLKGGKLLIAGNGGSLCDAMHFAEELTGQFREKRKALPAIAFSEPGHLTCIANDMGYDQVFSRAVEAYGKEEDIFIALTTSGNSPNLVRAVEQAMEMKLKTICFLGKTGGNLKGKSNLEWIIEGFSTSDRIQEAHMAAIHIIIEMVEHNLFGSKKTIKEMENSHV